MHRAVPLLVALVALGALSGCAKSKPNESPAPAASADAGATPARTAQPLLCSDGVHRRGDHWKKECNPCRCGADGEIVCAEFACPAPAPASASAPASAQAVPVDAGGARDAAR